MRKAILTILTILIVSAMTFPQPAMAKGKGFRKQMREAADEAAIANGTATPEQKARDAKRKKRQAELNAIRAKLHSGNDPNKD
ncbi:hypothetical protein EN836_27990 [Mesorhizobium sp. M1C.F.Ca.ET.193.01.1.1]|uniref:hypothetical protein n=1 Tax=unclassified Mesorhizobium TaxID=325217 RepID=UPI000FD35683|nr:MULTISPECIES: hypothetical protein [unclassified Mesorhizobium]TGS93434.1 hypothetical protein EN820_48650 [bacterium M00.F.Ca.ET.177.01.1.1]TGQ50722.1 hypothetical protein EN853_27980 [Mesorhizobium sp. M1C.F.Ca.ET.210.01.1.1]TGQ65889.1 hypothetical protein EN855_027995 [Mesorhizobium sp. M1C.F.Ca.ET.212.01.1.1]TGQ99893.1 hypothetical protein EN847_27980 [Mesorhizobium sp. M1C.F.Ca.ET.204.01.1.1]TGR20427.1 hypothetical protein EN839_27980 [Mesorhizobium sp. M1C.F.Ca.ET.196.01.1.1]